MKTVNIEETTLDDCVAHAGQDKVILTRAGVPVALVVGIEGLDEEQIELVSSDSFWTMIARRRYAPSLSRAELEASLADHQ